MSRQLINQYYNNLDRAIQFGKSTNETAIRGHFWVLLNNYAQKYNYEVVQEVWCQGTKGRNVRPDGIVKNLFGLDIGLWESKDEKTSIDDEINLKIRTGYPLTNILFEDSATVILYQRGEETMRVSMRDADKLHTLITAFISFKNETIHKFEVALENFKADIPKIVEALRKRIEDVGQTNQSFIAVRDTFLALCKVEINPEITLADVGEMMIQHILTSDIFNRIFNDPDFHRHNTIARELENLIGALFTYSERRNLLGDIEHYYDAISAAASEVVDHHEKQKFLKVLYENFYKVYNPKAADRLGVVYTPNEIVQFMVESTDYLLHKHFGKTLADENVDILDPATGTGTFITSIIDHIPKHLLAHKYKNELHANEVAILPYYIANLNVEFTFKQKMGYYEEFTNLCFVDTLDNTDSLSYEGKQHSMFGLTSENSERIKKQNDKKISVIIGNPPYNANQTNYSDENKNRVYPAVDKRIKETFIKFSTATNKANLYDMYTRFYLWATDRIDENGVIAFVSNNSFINSRAFDGFRKIVAEQFNEVWIIDLKGNARTSGERRRAEGGNVFSDLIRVGIAVYFLVRKKNVNDCRIYYTGVKNYAKAEEKKDYLRANKLNQLEFNHVIPDKDFNWINLSDNDFETLLPLLQRGSNENGIFNDSCLGIDTHRDSWVYDVSTLSLENKIRYFIDVYSSSLKSSSVVKDRPIAWSRELKNLLDKKTAINFDINKITRSNYRPFIKRFHYTDKKLNSYLFYMLRFFQGKNKAININVPGNSKGFFHLSSDNQVDLHFTGDTRCIPLYDYDKSGKRLDNITDWALNLFQNHYKQKARTEKELNAMSADELAAFTENKPITKEDIFHYTYGVLHNPAYRKKYELDLKREFPRLPLYDDFYQWAAWGKQLMDLHINYESVEPYPLKLIETQAEIKEAKQNALFNTLQEPEALYRTQSKIKVKLKADKEIGIIELDEQTALRGIPKQAWEYKLGNRSALEWVLDQYKEKKHTDATIAEKFNTYRFANYKEQVINLLKRVCTVSIETVRIVREMEKIFK